MNTVSERELRLLASWEDTAQRFTVSSKTHTREELLMFESLVEREYARYNEMVVEPSETSGTLVEYHGVRLTEKGLLALRSA